MNEVIQALPDGPSLQIHLSPWGVIWRGVLLLLLAAVVVFIGVAFFGTTGANVWLGIVGFMYGCLCHSFFRAVTASDGFPNTAVNMLLFFAVPLAGLVLSRGKGWPGVIVLLGAAGIAKVIDHGTEGLSTFGLF